MRIRMDFDLIEEYILEIDDLTEEMKDYKDKIEKKIENIVDITDGEFAKGITSEYNRRVENIRKIINYNDEIKGKIEKFIEEYKELDENETIGEYSIDTDEIEENKKSLESFRANINYLNKDIEFESFLEDFKAKKRKYKNEKMSEHKICKEYEDDEITAQYLIERKHEIEEQISDMNYNMNIIDEVNDLLKN